MSSPHNLFSMRVKRAYLVKSFIDILKINNIDVLRLEKQCVKTVHVELACGDIHMHIGDVWVNRKGGT